jgi:hypothetical protein
MHIPRPEMRPAWVMRCRLPLDSARKLRWFDKGDLPNIVKTHAREKRELLDAITALKKVCAAARAGADARAAAPGC